MRGEQLLAATVQGIEMSKIDMKEPRHLTYLPSIFEVPKHADVDEEQDKMRDIHFWKTSEHVDGQLDEHRQECIQHGGSQLGCFPLRIFGEVSRSSIE